MLELHTKPHSSLLGIFGEIAVGGQKQRPTPQSLSSKAFGDCENS